MRFHRRFPLWRCACGRRCNGSRRCDFCWDRYAAEIRATLTYVLAPLARKETPR